MMTRNLLPLSLLCGTVLLSSGGCKQREESSTEEAYRMQGDTVYVRGAQLTATLRTGRSEVAPYAKTVIASGKVQALPSMFMQIAPPFAGRIVEIFCRIGQPVEAGTPLFSISSPDFTAAQRDYFQALSACSVARKNADRARDLSERKIVSQKDLEAAENDLAIAESDLNNAISALKVYQVTDPERMTLGQPLIVRSPIRGEFCECAVGPGQYVKDDAEPVAVVDDLSKVWIVADVKEKDIQYVRRGQRVEVTANAFPGKTYEGVVYDVKDEVDEETRSIKVIAECENPGEQLARGMYTSVSLVSEPIDLVRVPEKSLMQGMESSFIYVEASPGVYVKRDVVVERVSDGIALVSDGLRVGETIITEGGYYLK